jgi:hypothetical protein
MMIKVVRMPPVYEAVLFDGDNMEEIAGWLGLACFKNGNNLVIGTPKGSLIVGQRDVVTKDEDGGIESWKPDSFGKAFEPLSNLCAHLRGRMSIKGIAKYRYSM